MRTSPLDSTIDTVAGYLLRRRRSALALTAGEAATFAIAVVRGCAAAPSRAAGAQWRITAGGRPVLVEDAGGDDVLGASVAVLDDLISLVPPDVRPGFVRLRDALLTEPPPTWEILERRLLGVIEPQPIVLGPLSPAEPHAAPPAAGSDQDADLPGFVALARATARRVRPRVVLASIGAAAVVLVVAMTMTAPSGDAAGAEPATPTDVGAATEAPHAGSHDGADAEEADGAMPSPATTAPGSMSATPPSSAANAGPVTASDGPSGAGSDGVSGTSPTDVEGIASDDVDAAAFAVLSSLAACTDAVCAVRFREAQAGASEPAPLNPGAAQLEVIDDFGGLAVIRLTEGERTQYVTLVRENDRWLVRSVRDVADQPS